mmetsp:Transcript_19381/g.53216  ORF Transcript_19381/g.53216 Transcript_19381/m.53216 type:complete len:350 (-) Transcript_19381:51-1100(-)
MASGGNERTPLLKSARAAEGWAFCFNVGLPTAVGMLGVLMLMYLESWPVEVATYVVTQIVTTVGYGDFTVQSPSAKLFMVFYSIMCLVILAYFYSMLVEKVVKWEADHLRTHLLQIEASTTSEETDVKKAKERFGAHNKVIAATTIFLLAVVFGMCFYRLTEHCTCSYGIQGVETCDATSFETCVATGGYRKEWSDALYMSMITLTTVGFGDFQPRTFTGRLCGSIWMLLGCACTANFIGAIAKVLFEGKKKKKFVAADMCGSIDSATFKRIDRNGDGGLSRGEFLAYMLAQYGFIPSELLDEIDKVYDALDVKGNNFVAYSSIQARHQMMHRAQNPSPTRDASSSSSA